MNYCVFYMDITRDVSKVIDYLKVRLLYNVTSYFWWGGEKSNIYIMGGGGKEIEKIHKKLISWDDEQKCINFGINFRFNSQN